MNTLSNNDIAHAVYLLSKDKTHAEQVTLSEKVTKFLFRKRILSKAPQILEQLEKITNKAEKRVIAKVTSAEKIDHKTALHIKHFVEKHYRADEVVLNEVVDKSVLGGLKIEMNGEVLDLSIKNKVEKLQAHLIKD